MTRWGELKATGAPKVKPLVWVLGRSKGALVKYRLSKTFTGEWKVFVNDISMPLCRMMTEREAYAAAQADYESRIWGELE